MFLDGFGEQTRENAEWRRRQHVDHGRETELRIEIGDVSPRLRAIIAEHPVKDEQQLGGGEREEQRCELARRHRHSAASSAPPFSRMRRSISGRKCLIRPWIGHAAASPSAQMVWPSTCLVTSNSVSISLRSEEHTSELKS